MSKFFDKLISGFIILAVVVAAITAFRSNLLSSSAAYDAFVAVFDCFPFANEMAAMSAHIGQFGTTLQGLTPSNILDDIAKIYGMAITCPIIISPLTMLCLPVPDYKDWRDRERYMNRLSYRIKECTLSVLLLPPCAYLTAYGLDVLQELLQQEMPAMASGLISFAAMILVLFVSVIVGCTSKPLSIGFLFRHRLIYDLLGGVLKILGMNFLCFFIALAILNDQDNVALRGIVAIFIYLAGIELIIGSFMNKPHNS